MFSSLKELNHGVLPFTIFRQPVPPIYRACIMLEGHSIRIMSFPLKAFLPSQSSLLVEQVLVLSIILSSENITQSFFFFYFSLLPLKH